MILDCFTYMDERELLLARLEYLKDTVDIFVIVEAAMTFQGAPRELDFPTIRPRITLPDEQIRYVTVGELPVDKEAWECERRVRDAILDGLTGIDDDALIVISDVDEIINRRCLLSLSDEVVTPVALSLRYFTYKVDWEWLVPWTKPRALRRRDLVSPNALRREKGLPVIENAGWHISWLGGEERVRNKIASFSHSEMRDLLKAPHHLRMCLKHGIDLLGRGVLRKAQKEDVFPGFPQSVSPAMWAPPRTVRQIIGAYVYNFAIPGIRRLGFPTDRMRFALGLFLAAPLRVVMRLTNLGSILKSSARNWQT